MAYCVLRIRVEIRNTQYVPMPFPHLTDPVPWLNTDQMIEVDRAMTEDYRIELIQMMENAGRNLAHLARRSRRFRVRGRCG